MPASENVDANGKPRKKRKLLPDAVPSIGIGKNPIDAAAPSETSGLVLDPGMLPQNVPIPDTITDMIIDDVESSVESQDLEPKSPEIVVQQDLPEPIIIDIPLPPYDPNLETIEQLRAEIDLLKKLQSEDKQKIARLEKENAELRILKGGFSEMKKTLQS